MTTSLEPREHEMAAAMLDVIAAARLADDRPRARAVIGAALADATRDPALALAAAGGLAWMAAAGICGGDDKGTADMVLDQCRRSLVWGMAEGTTSQYEANIGVTVLQLAAPRQSWDQLYRRARKWADDRCPVDSLDVVMVAAELIHFLISPPFGAGTEQLDDLTVGIMGRLAELPDDEQQLPNKE